MHACLSQIVPVVYGAVLSFAMYSIAELALRIRQLSPVHTFIEGELIGPSEGFQRIVMFGLVMAYVIDDVGELLRLDTQYKFRKSTRFSQEIWIALFYALAFAHIRYGSYLAVVWLGFALLLGGTWCNALKHEYADDRQQIGNLASALRFASYVGAAIFIPGGLILCRLRLVVTTDVSKIAYPFLTFRPQAFTPLRTIAFCIGWLFWWWFAESWAMFWAGTNARAYMLPYAVPRSRQQSIERLYSTILRPLVPILNTVQVVLSASGACITKLSSTAGTSADGIRNKLNSDNGKDKAK